MRYLAPILIVAASIGSAAAQSFALPDDDFLFTAAKQYVYDADLTECACRHFGRSHGNASQTGAKKPWILFLTQTSDYGTNLTLPIGLTPANTLVGPFGGPFNILGGSTGPGSVVNQLGLQQILGLAPGAPPPPTPSTGFFPNDAQFQTTAGAQYQRAVGDDGTFTASYSYYQNLHPSVQQLNLQSHTPTLQYAHKLTDRLVATSYYTYSYYFLEGNTFVDQNRTGMFLTFLANDRWDWTVRGDYNHANFQAGPFLNSDNYAGTLEATRYVGEGRNNYLRMGYGYGYSDAQYRGFAYQLNNAYAIVRKLFGPNSVNELRLTGSYGTYDFFGVDPIALIPRADRIFTGNIFLGRTLATGIQVFASYTYLNSDSNVTRQQYDSSLTSVGIIYAR